jgi:hypothetical protein
MLRVPASATAPPVGLLGVNPVEPALKDVTPPAAEKVRTPAPFVCRKEPAAPSAAGRVQVTLLVVAAA